VRTDKFVALLALFSAALLFAGCYSGGVTVESTEEPILGPERSREAWGLMPSALWIVYGS
jgi:hypothetical protein